jgi:hypothetical protein
MDINKDDLLLFVKILIFVYIVASPFISHVWLRFVNYTAIKILLLIIIVFLSFIDLQLAVLAMIAFLIILVNLNKEDIKNMTKTADKKFTTSEELKNHISSIIQSEEHITQTKEHMVRGHSIFPIPSDILEVEKYQNIDGEQSPDVNFEEYQNQNIDAEQSQNPFPEKSHGNNYDDESEVRQTISEFPKPYCNIIEYDPILISQGLSDYSLDYRTKPYEEYLRHLSPNKSIENIQTNMIN